MGKNLKNVHSSAKRLHDAGFMNDLTMPEFEALCLTPCPEFTAADVVRIRAKSRAGQGVFAAFLNGGGRRRSRLGNSARKSRAGQQASCLRLLIGKGLDALA